MLVPSYIKTFISANIIYVIALPCIIVKGPTIIKKYFHSENSVEVVLMELAAD